jgi:hypothetical protein
MSLLDREAGAIRGKRLMGSKINISQEEKEKLAEEAESLGIEIDPSLTVADIKEIIKEQKEKKNP